MKKLIFILFFVNFLFSSEKMEILINGSFEIWEKDKPIGWEIKNCIKGEDGKGILFFENGICRQKLKNITEKTKYRIEFIYKLPDYGRGDIRWEIKGVKGKNLSNRYTTPYFHTKSIRVVDYFYIEKIEGEPEIIFLGGGKNTRTFLDEVIISPTNGGFTGVYVVKEGDLAKSIFSIFNNKETNKKYKYSAEIVNFYMEKIFEKCGEIYLKPKEYFKFEIPFYIGNSKIYRTKIEVVDENGDIKEDICFVESDEINFFRKSFRIPTDNWVYYILKRDGSQQSEKQKIKLPFKISTPNESFHSVYRFLSKIDIEKNWYAIFEKDIFIPDFKENERVFIEIPRAANSPEVFINDKKAGSFEGRIPIFLDITDYVKKDCFNNLKIKVGTWKTGYEWNEDGVTMKLPYNGDHQGILSFNNFIHILPSIRIDNVYIKTSYRRKRIYLEYIIENNTKYPRVVSIRPEILDNGKVIKKLKEGKALIRGESKQKVVFEEAWTNPKLWMIKNPYLYRLRTKLFSEGEQLDEYNIRFGFREIWTEGKYIFLNGKKIKLRTRLSFPTPLHAGIPLNYDTQWRALRQYTDNGIWFSRSFTIQDPFFIDLCDEMGYALRHSFELNAAFVDWRQKISKDERFWNIMEEHVRKLLIENRNHPSILFWSIENESFLCGLGDQMPWTIEKYKKLRELARGIHPGIILEHDGSEPENDCELINLHYPLNPVRTIPYSPIFPPEIFEKDRWYGLQLYPGSLLWDEKKPLVLGEDFIGFPEVPQSLSILNDEDVYNVLEENPRQGINYEKFDISYHRLHEPFMKKAREREIGYITTWPLTDMGWSDTLKDVAIFIKEPFKNFKSGEIVNLNGIICYDLFEDAKVNLIWEYKDEKEKLLCKGEKKIFLKTGDVKEFTIKIKNPEVKNKMNTKLSIKLFWEDKIIAEKTENYRVYPKVKFPDCEFILYDNIGQTIEKFKKINLKFKTGECPEKWKLFVIGKNCLMQDEILKIKDKIIKFVEEGGKVLILQQEGEIKQILPFEIIPNKNTYSYAVFPRAYDHPILKNIEREGLYFWKDRGYHVSRNNYWKPEMGNYISILDGGTIGGFLTSSLIEIYIGNGSFILSQLNLIENLGKDPVAELILSNILDYSKKEVYRKTEKSVKIIGDKQFIEKMKNLKFFNISDDSEIIIVNGGNLNDLSTLERITNSVRDGGIAWIINIKESSLKIWEKFGLKIKEKGYTHIIKKTYDPIIAGLSNTDLFWVGMALAPLPGEWYSRGVANIIDYECKIDIDNAIELIDKGALIKIPYGKGFILIDNMNWYKYLDDDSVIKAKKIFTTIATNLGIKINPDIQLLSIDKEKIKFYPIDISSILNEKTVDISQEKFIFDGIPFLNQKGFLLLGSENLTQPEKRLKSKIEFNLGEKFDILFFLMTAYDPYEGGQGYGWGEHYGGVEILYEDNTTKKIYFLHKVHCVNIFEYMGDLLKGKVVYSGSSIFSSWLDMYTRWPGNRWIQKEHLNNIYLVKWINPYPNKKIEKMIFYSSNVHVVPIIISITGGRYDK